MSAKFYQNIPNCLRVKFHCFQNLNLGKTSTYPKCHLTISRATSYQYQCICKFHHNFPLSSRDSAIFIFFQNLELGKASTDENVISQFLGQDHAKINVYAKVYQNIPLNSRDRAIFTFSEFESRQRLGQFQMTFDTPLGYILSISMRMQNVITIFQTV